MRMAGDGQVELGLLRILDADRTMVDKIDGRDVSRPIGSVPSIVVLLGER